MARASPSCATMANSLACALLSAASVATRAMVVFSPGRPFAFRVSAAGGTVGGNPRPPNSPSTSNGAAQKCGPRPTFTLPQALTATSAPTVCPSRVTAEAEPSLEIDGGGAEAGAGGSERKRLAGARSGGVAEIAIGRKAPPVLVAAVEEVEQHGAAHDRHANVPDREATSALAQQSLNARAGVQAEGGAAGQHHGIDALDGAVRFEQIGFPRARRAAAHVDRGHRRLLEHNGGHAGGETRLVGVSDQDARDVRDEIALRQYRLAYTAQA